MKLPCKYKAKAIHSGGVYTGYYFQYPERTYCMDTDPKPRIIHALVTYTMTDWGLPNRVQYVEIDPETLEEVKE